MNKVPSNLTSEEPISYYKDSNGITHENVYIYGWYDEQTQTRRRCIGDRDKNIIEDISNPTQEDSFFIKYKGQIIAGAIIITATVAVIIVKNPGVIPATAEVVGPAVGRILSVISKPNPQIVQKLTKDIFIKSKKILPFIVAKIPDLFHEAEASNGIPSDPLIFDLDGDGIKLTTIEEGVYFDYDNDGFAELTSWINSNDGMLVIDNNSNNKIDNGSELVLTDTLQQYDLNNDGIIDINDEIYSQLKILKGDGKLLSLDEAKIVSINLNTKPTEIIDQNGNEQFIRGSYTKNDGSIKEFGGFMLQKDNTNSLPTEIIEISEEIEELPYIDSFGKLYDLHQAMMQDETNRLKTLVQAFVSETNDDARMSLVDQILEQWANASNIEQGSRGEFIEAKKLAVLETFIGENFVSYHKGEITPENPNKEAGQIRKEKIAA